MWEVDHAVKGPGSTQRGPKETEGHPSCKGKDLGGLDHGVVLALEA